VETVDDANVVMLHISTRQLAPVAAVRILCQPAVTRLAADAWDLRRPTRAPSASRCPTFCCAHRSWESPIGVS
jgi:hypothetical protein